MANQNGGKQLGENKEYLALYVSKEAHEKLIKIAEQRELNKSDIVREAIREYLEKRDTA